MTDNKLVLQAGFIGLLVSAVFISFWPILQAGFVNWDDPVHLTDTPLVRSLSFENIKAVFSSTVNRIYIPLTTLSFAVEYHFFGLDPFVFHLNNLVLHALATVLVFYLGRRMGLSGGAALFAGLMFGLHPLKVESVAWVTERKDVLCAVFYLAALHAYLKYTRVQRLAWLGVTAAAGILALLAKPMALSLPLILVLLDWWEGRRPLLKAVREKLALAPPFAFIVILTYTWHARLPMASWSQAPLIWLWCFVFYLKKFVFPWPMVLLYNLPRPVAVTTGAYAGALGIFIILAGVVWRLRRNRWLVFAVLFYFLSIFFLLRMDARGDFNVVAERFMYIPSIGICLGLGAGMQAAWDRWRRWPAGRWSLGFVVAVLIAGMSSLTFSQARVWRSSLSLWENQWRYRPDVATAMIHFGLAHAYEFERGDWQKAARHYRQALDIKPDFKEAEKGLQRVRALEKQATGAPSSTRRLRPLQSR